MNVFWADILDLVSFFMLTDCVTAYSPFHQTKYGGQVCHLEVSTVVLEECLPVRSHCSCTVYDMLFCFVFHCSNQGFKDCYHHREVSWMLTIYDVSFCFDALLCTHTIYCTFVCPRRRTFFLTVLPYNSQGSKDRHCVIKALMHL